MIDMIWYDNGMIYVIMVWYDTILYMIGYDWYDNGMIWYDSGMIYVIMVYDMIRYDMIYDWYDMIYLTATGLTPSGSSTVHIYTQTIHRTTQWKRIPRTEHT